MTTEKVEERATMNDERNKESLKLVLTLIVDYWFTRLKDQEKMWKIPLIPVFAKVEMTER